MPRPFGVPAGAFSKRVSGWRRLLCPRACARRDSSFNRFFFGPHKRSRIGNNNRGSLAFSFSCLQKKSFCK